MLPKEHIVKPPKIYNIKYVKTYNQLTCATKFRSRIIVGFMKWTLLTTTVGRSLFKGSKHPTEELI